MRRTVIVTGGTKGLGREIALAFSRNGYFVIALYRSDHEAAAVTRGLLLQEPGEGSVWQQDVSAPEPEIFRRPEIADAESLVLVHNACESFSPQPMHQTTWESVDRGLRVAVKGGWLFSQGLIRPMLQKGGGGIINILSSVLEGPPPKGFSAYLTAKHALRGLTLALAAEYGERGVKIFSASPGYMDTSLTAGWDARLSQGVRSTSRNTDPREAAERIVQLFQEPKTPGKGEDYTI